VGLLASRSLFIFMGRVARKKYPSYSLKSARSSAYDGFEYFATFMTILIWPITIVVLGVIGSGKTFGPLLRWFYQDPNERKKQKVLQ
jgi:hypothetical protein